MTIALYARRKQWPLDDVEVRLRHSRVHAQDCRDCDTKEGMLDVIESEISLHGELSAEQRNRLREVAQRLRRSLQSRGSGLLPGLGAGPDQLDDFVNALWHVRLLLWVSCGRSGRGRKETERRPPVRRPPTRG